MKNQQHSSRNLRTLLASHLALLVVLPILLGADEPNRRTIEKMTPAQRTRLERNYKRFLNMSPREQQRYRELHRRLQDDLDADQLRETMLRYRNWLKTLSPFQRQQLKETTGIADRLELVRQFKHEQEVHLRPEESAPQLGRENLARLMTVIEEELPPSAVNRNQLAALPLVLRHLKVLAESMRGTSSPRRFRPNMRGWPESRLLEKLSQAIPPEDDFLKRIESMKFDEDRRRVLVSNMFDELRREWQDFVASERPSPEALTAFREQLDPREREELNNLSRSERQRRLMNHYIAKRRQDLLKDSPELRMLFSQMSPRVFQRPPRGPRPGPGRGGRPRDKRFDRRRPSPLPYGSRDR